MFKCTEKGIENEGEIELTDDDLETILEIFIETDLYSKTFKFSDNIWRQKGE